MGLEIRQAVALDVPNIANVFSQAAVRKTGHGDNLWGDQPYTNDEITARLMAGGLHTVISEGYIVATVTITRQDVRMWGDAGEARALYVHGLATADAARGQNLGGRILEWVADQAKVGGREAVRLDCSYENTGLCQYYERFGFTQVRHVDVPRRTGARNTSDSIYRAALFQRAVS